MEESNPQKAGGSQGAAIPTGTICCQQHTFCLNVFGSYLCSSVVGLFAWFGCLPFAIFSFYSPSLSGGMSTETQYHDVKPGGLRLPKPSST
jgi:hypothetical protein